ncbi:MAG: hypothetical protein ABI858_08100 [Pseudoxanthomonas sp.]
MRELLLLFALSFTTTAQAQQVYKCVEGADVAYQSQPCSTTQRTLRQWDATPDTESAAGTVTLSKTKSSTSRTPSSRRPSRSNTQTKTDPADARCSKAKARREAKLKAVGLKRTFDLLRKLDDAVYAACR